MATYSTPTNQAFSAGTGSGDTVDITKPSRFVTVTNTHASQSLYVTVKTGLKASRPATTAVANADDVFTIPAGATIVVASSPKRTQWNLSIVGSGASTTGQVVATDTQPVASVSNTVSGTIIATGTEGKAAADAAVTGNPVQIAGYGSTAVPTAMSTDGDVTRPWLTLTGEQVVLMHQSFVSLAATPTMANAGAYTSGDVVGDVMTFTGAALASGRAGRIRRATLIDKAAQSLLLELWLFAVTPSSPAADNAAHTLTDANLASAVPIGVIDFLAANYKASGANSVCVGTLNGAAVDLPFVSSGSANIFGLFVSRGTPTYASGDLIARLVIEQH